MNAAKRDLSGVFRPIHSASKNNRRSLREKTMRVSANGVTFSSPSYMAPFTEVQVKVELSKGRPASHSVSCSGVVVDCQGNQFTNQYNHASKMPTTSRRL